MFSGKSPEARMEINKLLSQLWPCLRCLASMLLAPEINNSLNSRGAAAT